LLWVSVTRWALERCLRLSNSARILVQAREVHVGCAVLNGALDDLQE